MVGCKNIHTEEKERRTYPYASVTFGSVLLEDVADNDDFMNF
jgi:hypothetical protein